MAYVSTLRTALLVALALPASVIARAADAPEPDSNAVAGLELLEPAASDDTVAGDSSAEPASPLRITLAHEAAYKVAEPDTLVKNRTSARLEYSRYFRESFF